MEKDKIFRPKTGLSKSQFIKGMQCHKALYLYKYYPELKAEQDEATQKRLATGTYIGELAQQFFPTGVLATPNEPFDLVKGLQRTKELIENGVNSIYEAAFQHNGNLAIVDILFKWENRWEIYEVKSSTGVKDYHYNDIAYQYYVLTNAGLDIKDAVIFYLNRNYVRQGELNCKELFMGESVIEDVLNKQTTIQEKIEEIKSMLKSPHIPIVGIGEHCDNPFSCELSDICWKDIPDNSVFEIWNLSGKRKFELYNKGRVLIKDVPSHFKLNKVQQIQINSIKNNEMFLDKEAIKEFVNNLVYPLQFLDFETMMPPLPLFDNSSPYQHIAFQFSLHCSKHPYATLVHKYFLGNPPDDPRIPFIEELIRSIEPKGDILVYNKAFEIARLNELSKHFPCYTEELQKIIRRIKDLYDPFRRSEVYLPAMRGFKSLKSVLPAITNDNDYSNLTISDGGMAMDAYYQLHFEKDKEKIQQTRDELLKYCKLDTLALVKIWEWLEEVSG